jgi:hypothetical protein
MLNSFVNSGGSLAGSLALEITAQNTKYPHGLGFLLI